MTNPDRSAILARSLSATGRALRKYLWAWPLIAAVILTGLGIGLRMTVEGVMQSQMDGQLRALLRADVEAVRILFGAHRAMIQVAADDPRVRSLARDLAASEDVSPAALLRSSRPGEMQALLGPWIHRGEYDGFSVFNPDGVIVAASRPAMLGTRFPEEDAEFVAEALSGRTTVSRPFPSVVMLADLDGKERVGVPTMFVAAPIRGDDGRVVGAIGFRMRPERAFTHILNVARFGKSGETYAFDRSGRLLSQTRFDDELKHIGLIADQPHVRSILNLDLRDPQVDLSSGARPPRRRGDQPLTRMAAEAVQGRAGSDVSGYRNYRGVLVVGAWDWLPEYGFGVATEVDRGEAYRPLVVLRTAFWGLFGVLAAGAVAVFALMYVVTRLRQKVRRAVQEARQLGQYTLEDRIGAGGMGVVYRARHALLRRPTAVKLLDPDRASDGAIARFEREVQLTSRLNHPNTIAIYDYGRTPEGAFYYAMELLDGLSLDGLVGRFGPQPEGRVIHILEQVCGSLAEAHEIGLVHRDIKPANIMLNRRGGIADFVKVLDFGLVKALDETVEMGLTATGAIAGTPQYLAPEQVDRPDEVDARSDLYAVGAVGYFLLTGTPAIRGGSLAEVLFKQVSEVPEAPSARLGAAVSADVEGLILGCLSKSREGRPPNARALASALLDCRSASSWGALDAEAWWRANVPPKAERADARSDPAAEFPTVETTMTLPGDATVAHRLTPAGPGASTDGG